MSKLEKSGKFRTFGPWKMSFRAIQSNPALGSWLIPSLGRFITPNYVGSEPSWSDGSLPTCLTAQIVGCPWLAVLITYLNVHYTLWLFKINGYIFVIAVLVCMRMYVCVSVLVCLYAMILCCLWGCVLAMASMGTTAKFQHTSLHLIL